MLALGIVKNNQRPLGGDKAIAGGVVGNPQLHVGGVGGVANVERVVQDNRGNVAAQQFGANALQTIAADGVHVRRRQPQRAPFALGRLARAQPMHIKSGIVIVGHFRFLPRANFGNMRHCAIITRFGKREIRRRLIKIFLQTQAMRRQL